MEQLNLEFFAASTAAMLATKKTIGQFWYSSSLAKNPSGCEGARRVLTNAPA